MTDWAPVADLLRHPDAEGCGPIQLLADEEFYDEDDLPFILAEGGSIVHVLPDAGFPKEALAASREERVMIVDHPDGEGWLVPDDIVSGWMNRNITCPDLEDLVLAHPLYEYLTQLDEDGYSRGGHRGELLQWAPGLPTLASIYSPEWLPEDPDAPRINRDRDAYADGVADLLGQLERRFAPVEIEVGVRFGRVDRGDLYPDEEE